MKFCKMQKSAVSMDQNSEPISSNRISHLHPDPDSPHEDCAAQGHLLRQGGERLGPRFSPEFRMPASRTTKPRKSSRSTREPNTSKFPKLPQKGCTGQASSCTGVSYQNPGAAALVTPLTASQRFVPWAWARQFSISRVIDDARFCENPLSRLHDLVRRSLHPVTGPPKSGGICKGSHYACQMNREVGARSG